MLELLNHAYMDFGDLCVVRIKMWLFTFRVKRKSHNVHVKISEITHLELFTALYYLLSIFGICPSLWNIYRGNCLHIHDYLHWLTTQFHH